MNEVHFHLKVIFNLSFFLLTIVKFSMYSLYYYFNRKFCTESFGFFHSNDLTNLAYLDLLVEINLKTNQIFYQFTLTATSYPFL